MNIVTFYTRHNMKKFRKHCLPTSLSKWHNIEIIKPKLGCHPDCSFFFMFSIRSFHQFSCDSLQNHLLCPLLSFSNASTWIKPPSSLTWTTAKDSYLSFHFLAQEMFSTQGLDLRLLHCRGILVAVIIDLGFQRKQGLDVVI